MEHRHGSVIVSVDKRIDKSQDSMVRCIATMLSQALDNEVHETILMWGIGQAMERCAKMLDNPIVGMMTIAEMQKDMAKLGKDICKRRKEEEDGN